MRDEFLDPGISGADDADVASEIELEAGLRPRALDEFVGQRELKEHLRIVLEAARKREQSVDHLLFAGPPGLGKTTLAGNVAHTGRIVGRLADVRVEELVTHGAPPAT